MPTSWSPLSAVPEILGAEHVKPGATVIDVGINRRADGLVAMSTSPLVSSVAGAITPGPWGESADDHRLSARQHRQGSAGARDPAMTAISALADAVAELRGSR